LYGKLRDWLQAGGAIEDNSLLSEDLSAADYLFNQQGRLLLEAKDSIRSRLGRSPDRADALALTFAVVPAVVMPGDMQSAREMATRRRTYDPYSRLTAMA
jgi:hypothetical protein